MTTNKRQFVLPSKVDAYLATLNRLYEKQNETILSEIVVNGAVSIHEEWDYDNWNGGTYGHAVTLTVSEELYLNVVDEKDAIQSKIASDLSKLDNSPNEHISAVFIEMEPAGHEDWRQQTGVYRPRTHAPSIAPDALRRIWGAEHVRVFLSHKSSVKEDVAALKAAFSMFCGVTSFVAHEDIEPTEEWQREIESALFSMDALIALLTEDFHDSNWTDQEVGIALGRGVPVIAIRLGMDPYGLMGKNQGLGGCTWGDYKSMAANVFALLHKRLPDKSRLYECALTAYAGSQSFADSAWKVKNLLSVFETLSSDQVQRLLEAYHANNQNAASFCGMDILQPLLRKWTGKEWIIHRNRLQLSGLETDGRMP